MADYYPLLNRAVAGLAGQPETARQAIYARARAALERQLRSFDPALDEAAILAELADLEATVARIEAEQAAPEEPLAPDMTPPMVDISTAETAPAPEADETPTSGTDEAASLPKEAEETPLEAASPAEEAEEPRVEAPSPPEEAGDKTENAEEHAPEEASDTVAEAPEAPAPRPPLTATRPTVNDLPPKEEMGLPLLPPQRLSESEKLAAAIFPPDDEEADPFLAAMEPPAALSPVMRPRMPSRRSEDKPAGSKPLAIFAGFAVLAIIGMGALALSRRGTPERTAQPPAIVAPETPADTSKTEGRLSNAENPGKTPDRTPEPREASKPAEPAIPPPAQAQSAPAQAPSAETKPAVVVQPSHRAFMVLEVQGGAPSQFEGRTNWTFAPDPALKGQRSLRAAITFPQAQMSIDVSIARNTDAAINASHTVMVVFETLIENVLDMSAIEWRERENLAGTLLAGIVVPIQENVFMIGLDKGEAAVARNLDLMRSQKWMVFEFRLVNGRRGAILIEKGPSGEQAINDALASWK
jgi:hypothetical protein